MSEKPRTIMAVHAHPDDESTSTGGVLSRYAALGARTVVVTCTGGEVGEIAEPSLAQPHNLAEVRRQELEMACEILGVSQLYMLGYRDSGMAGTPDNDHPESFHRVDLHEAVGRLVELIRHERPDVLVTYDDFGFYGHPDHIQANRITVAAWEAAGDASRYTESGPPWSPLKLYYSTVPRSAMRRFGERLRSAGIEAPIGEAEPSWGSPDEMITTIVDVAAWVEKKYAALMAHRTQMGPNVFFSRLPPTLFYELFGRETFIRQASRIDTPEREDDLLAGLEGAPAAGR